MQPRTSARTRLARALLLTILAAGGARAQAVEGTVVDAFTGAPIPEAFVGIVDQAGKTVAGAPPDADGRFHIEGVKDGTYRTRAFAPEYPLHFPDPPPFQVAGGSAKLEVRLSRRAKLSGRVLDASGAAVAEARILLNGVIHGQIFSGQMSATTDGEGRFDILADSGSYLLSVEPPPGRKPPPPDRESGAERAWARTYYPGAVSADAAAPLEVHADMPNLEWKLQPAPTHAVRGVLLNPDGTPAPDVDLDIGEDPQRPTFGATSRADGSFEFRLPDGEWWVTAELGGAFVDRPRVRQSIRVAGRDLEDLQWRFHSPFTLRGQVRMETPPEPKQDAPAHAPGLSLCLTAGSCTSANLDEHGNFAIESLYPGLYRIAPQNTPPGYYLDAIRVGAADWNGEPVELSAATSMLLVYKSGGGILRGKIENCNSGGVILVPADPALPIAPFSRQAFCSGANPDHYEFRDLRPGSYSVVAISGASPIPWMMAPADGNVLRQATAVTVKGGESVGADLRAVVASQ